MSNERQNLSGSSRNSFLRFSNGTSSPQPTSEYASYGAPPSYEDSRYFQHPPNGLQPPLSRSQQTLNPNYGHEAQEYFSSPQAVAGNTYSGGSPVAQASDSNPFGQQEQGVPSAGPGGFRTDSASGSNPYSSSEKTLPDLPSSPSETRRQQPYPPPTGEPYYGEEGHSSRGFNTPGSLSTPNHTNMRSGSSPPQLLNPLPSSFHRPTPHNLPYSPFPPTTLISMSSQLDKGFPMLPPPATTSPHPFAMHDVNEEDWKRFLGDLKIASGLSVGEKVVAGVAPMAMGIGFLPGLFVSRGMESRMRSRKNGPVSEIVDHWNHYFFHPRQLDVTLAHGRTRLTGPDEGLPADIAYRKKHKIGRASDDDYSSDSSSSSSDGDYGHENGHGRRGVGCRSGGILGLRGELREGTGLGNGLFGIRGARRAERCERRAISRTAKMERKEMKRERRALKRERRRERKDTKDEKYRLVVSYRPLGVY